MDTHDIVLVLASLLSGGAAVAVIDRLFLHKRTIAETKKIEAEAERIVAETQQIQNGLSTDPIAYIRKAHLPDGWMLRGDAPSCYEVGVDTRVFHSEPCSGYLRSLKHSSGFGTLLQRFSAEVYRGKRLKMSAYIKTNNVQYWAGLWMRIDGPGPRMLSFDNMERRPIRGTVDWTLYSIVLDVPNDATLISFGVLLLDQGHIWVDDITFDAVRESEPTTGSMVVLEKPVNLRFEGPIQHHNI